MAGTTARSWLARMTGFDLAETLVLAVILTFGVWTLCQR